MINFPTEQRRLAKLEAFDSEAPQCCVCGEADVRCLENHHLAGRKYNDDTVVICRNCHRKLSDDQRDHPRPLGGKTSAAEVVVHALYGIADLLILIAEQCRKYAQQLFQSISGEEYSA